MAEFLVISYHTVHSETEKFHFRWITPMPMHSIRSPTFPFPPLIQTAVAADAASRMFYHDHQPSATQLVTRFLYIDICALWLELRLANSIGCIRRVRKKNEAVFCASLLTISDAFSLVFARIISVLPVTEIFTTVHYSLLL